MAKRMHLSFFDPVSSRLALLNRLLSTHSSHCGRQHWSATNLVTTVLHNTFSSECLITYYSELRTSYYILPILFGDGAQRHGTRDDQPGSATSLAAGGDQQWVEYTHGGSECVLIQHYEQAGEASCLVMRKRPSKGWHPLSSRT